MNTFLLRGALAFCALLAMAKFVSAESLYDAMAKAYATNPDLREARADLRAVDERMPQALSGWRPTLSITGSVGAQHSDSDNSLSQHLVPTSGQIDLTQPIYSGGETIAATSQALNEILAKRAELRGTEQNVLLDCLLIC